MSVQLDSISVQPFSPTSCIPNIMVKALVKIRCLHACSSVLMVQEQEAALVFKSEQLQEAKGEKGQVRRDLDNPKTTAEKQGSAHQAHEQELQQLKRELKVRSANSAVVAWDR